MVGVIHTKLRLLTQIFSRRIHLGGSLSRVLAPQSMYRLHSQGIVPWHELQNRDRGGGFRADLAPKLHRSLSVGRGTSKERSKHNFGLPNLLTMSRITLSPVLGWSIVAGYPIFAVIGLSAMAVTDFLDGYLARKWNMETNLGAILDPLADKLLINSVYVALSVTHVIPVWFCALVFIRDALLVAGAIILRRQNFKNVRMANFLNPDKQPVRVNIQQISKVNTALQLLLGGYCVLSLAVPDFEVESLRSFMILCVSASTIASGGRYLYLAAFKGLYTKL